MTGILVNMVKCESCNSILKSTKEDELIVCKCRKISIGGGRKKLTRIRKRKRKGPKEYIELSVMEIDYISYKRLIDSIEKFKEAADNVITSAVDILPETYNEELTKYREESETLSRTLKDTKNHIS